MEEMAATENAVTGGNEMPTPSSITVPGEKIKGMKEMATENAVTGGNETPTSSSVTVPGEMDTEKAVTGGNETPTPSSITDPEEKIKEIQAEIKKMHKHIGVGTGLLFGHAFIFRRKKKRREQIGVESRLTMTDVDIEKNLKLKEETFREDAEPMTVKNSKKDSAEIPALIGSVQKLDQQGKGVSGLKSVSSLQEEIETQKIDNGKTERHIRRAVRMLRALRGSSSDDDYVVFRNLKGDFDDHFRELLCKNGVLGSTKATVEGGKKETATVEGGQKETNTDCVIQSLAKRSIKDLQRTFFGSNIEYDPSDKRDVKTCIILECMEYHVCDLFRLYLAEELEKNKMASNGIDLKRRKTENIADCDVKSSLEKEEGGKSEA